MRMRGRRSKANAHDKLNPFEALFKGGTNDRPKRTLTWKLGVDAKLETGRLWVPSFSSTFFAAKAMMGGRLGIIKIHRPN